MDAKSKEAWATSRGLTESNGAICVERLLGRQCRHRDERDHLHSIPGSDHATLWCRDGAPAVYVSQPYGMDGEYLRALLEVCDAYGMSCFVDAWPSWHNPGSVLSVFVWKKGTQGPWPSRRESAT